MKNATIELARFKQRVSMDVSSFPTVLPNIETALLMDKAIVEFVNGLESGTTVRDLPSLVFTSDLFQFPEWSQSVIEAGGGSNVSLVRKRLKRLVLCRLSLALNSVSNAPASLDVVLV